MQINSVNFIKSVVRIQDCPNDGVPEIAVIGRSNVGKSSLINMLMGRTIAKASDRPGKTQCMNYFIVNKSWYFVDLPGYGYAKASLQKRRERIDEIHNYFVTRKPLILVLIDGRIPPQKIDLEFIEALNNENMDFTVILTKIDKVSQKELSKNLKDLKKEIQKLIGYLPKIILSSSVKKTGKEEIMKLFEETI